MAPPTSRPQRALFCAGFLLGANAAVQHPAQCATASDTFSTLQAKPSAHGKRRSDDMDPAPEPTPAPDYDSCTDSPRFWRDRIGEGCWLYQRRDFCTTDGKPGPGWDLANGEIPDFADSNGVSAFDACCACGGGDRLRPPTPAPTPKPTPPPPTRPCVDDPEGWMDFDGDDCAAYVRKEYCTPEGLPGDGWDVEAWGTLEDYPMEGNVPATTACCGCGGGRDPHVPTPKPTPVPTPAPGAPTLAPTPVPTPGPTAAACHPQRYYCEKVCLDLGTPTRACEMSCSFHFRSVRRVFDQYCRRGLCTHHAHAQVSVDHDGGIARGRHGRAVRKGSSMGPRCLSEIRYERMWCQAFSKFHPQAARRCAWSCHRHFKSLRALMDEYCKVGVCSIMPR